MARSTDPWIGKTDDSVPPPRVRLRVFERFAGKCHMCGRTIRAGETWTCEHLVAIINGGANAEPNLGLTCCNCLPDKNAADVTEKSGVAKIRKKHLGLHKAKRPFRQPPPGYNPWTRRIER